VDTTFSPYFGAPKRYEKHLPGNNINDTSIMDVHFYECSMGKLHKSLFIHNNIKHVILIENYYLFMTLE
jgi:hypothetical protein